MSLDNILNDVYNPIKYNEKIFDDKESDTEINICSDNDP